MERGVPALRGTSVTIRREKCPVRSGVPSRVVLDRDLDRRAVCCRGTSHARRVSSTCVGRGPGDITSVGVTTV